MLALITESALDIGFGIIWWATKKTGSALSYGISYLWSGEADPEPDEEEQFIKMSEFRGILEENNRQIKELSEKLVKLDAIKEI